MTKNTFNLPGMRTVQTNASWFARIGAFIIDLLILNVLILFPLQEILTYLIPNPTITNVESIPEPILQAVGFVLFFASLMMFAYFVLFEYAIGQTPGKMIFKLRVQGAKGLPSLWACLVRSIFIFPFFPFVLIWIIDPVYVIINKEHLRLSEKIVKTKTVQDVHV